MDESARLITVTSAGHHETLVSGLWNFFSSKNGLDYDFQRGGRSVRAHRLVVETFLPPSNTSTKSDEKTSTSDTSENDLNHGDHLEHLLEFMYRGSVSVLEDKLESLLAAAKDLQFQILVDAVESAKNTSRRPSRNVKNKQWNADAQVAMTYREEEEEDESDPDEEWQAPVTSKRLKLTRGTGRTDVKPKRGRAKKGCIKKKTKCITDKEKVNRKRRAGFRVVATSGEEPFDLETDSTVPVTKVEKDAAAVILDDEVEAETEPVKARRKPRVKPPSGVRRVPKSFVDPGLGLTKLEWKRAWYANLPVMECPHCVYKTRCQNRMKIHQAKHDPTVVVHRCDLCSRAYLSPETLARHKARHSIYKCPHCSFETEKQISHYQHLYYVHRVNSGGQPVEKKCKCDICGFTCVYECELKKHNATKHSNNKPFNCDLCTYSSTRKADLGKHVRNSHLHIKPYICEVCGHRWATQYHLERHKRTHAGDKLITTDAFGQPVVDTSALKMQPSEARPFICHVCGHSCSRQDNLKVHIKNVHKMTT